MWKQLWNPVGSRGWKSLEVSDKDPEVKEENLGLPREGLRGRVQNVGKGVDGKGHSDEVSEQK